MAKYIIEFNDEPNKDLDEIAYYSCKQVPWWSVSEGIIKRLTPYIEKDQEAVKKPKGLFERNKDKILQAGMECREIELIIDGRLFRIREVAQ